MFEDDDLILSWVYLLIFLKITCFKNLAKKSFDYKKINQCFLPSRYCTMYSFCRSLFRCIRIQCVCTEPQLCNKSYRDSLCLYFHCTSTLYFFVIHFFLLKSMKYYLKSGTCTFIYRKRDTCFLFRTKSHFFSFN